MSKFWFKIVIAGSFIFAVSTASLFGYYKYRALDYNFTDFPYYFQFATKIFNDKYTKHFTINPEGKNFLGIGGLDGGSNLQQGLHLELVKYAEGFVISLAGDWSPAGLIFAPILYYLPLIYLFFIFKDRDKRDRLLAALFALFYVFWPASLLSIAAFDFRPFALLTPVLLSLLLAFYCKRPDWELFLFFNLVFFVREEALVFNGLFLAYYIFRNLYQFRQKIKTIALLVGSYVVWVGIIAAYYYVQNFAEVVDPSLRFFKLLPKLIILSMVALAGAAGLFYFWKKGKNIFAFTDILFPMVLVSPFVLKISSGTYAGSFLYELMFSPRPGILIAAFLPTVFILRHYCPRLDKYVMGVLFAINLFIIFLFLLPKTSPITTINNYYHKQKTEFAKVWYWHSKLDRYNSRVITDTVTYQAFNDFEHVLPYDKLPFFITKSRSINSWLFPANIPILKKVLPDYQYIIVNKISAVDIEELAPVAGISLQKIDSDEFFNVYEIQKKI